MQRLDHIFFWSFLCLAMLLFLAGTPWQLALVVLAGLVPFVGLLQLGKRGTEKILHH